MVDVIKNVEGLRKWIQDAIAPELQVIKVELAHVSQTQRDMRQDMKDMEARLTKAIGDTRQDMLSSVAQSEERMRMTFENERLREKLRQYETPAPPQPEKQ